MDRNSNHTGVSLCYWNAPDLCCRCSRQTRLETSKEFISEMRTNTLGQDRAEFFYDECSLVPRFGRAKYTLLCSRRCVYGNLRTTLVPIRCLLIGLGELQYHGIASGRANDLHAYGKACAGKTT